jgi:hypothetical protein
MKVPECSAFTRPVDCGKFCFAVSSDGVAYARQLSVPHHSVCQCVKRETENRVCCSIVQGVCLQKGKDGSYKTVASTFSDCVTLLTSILTALYLEDQDITCDTFVARCDILVFEMSGNRRES